MRLAEWNIKMLYPNLTNSKERVHEGIYLNLLSIDFKLILYTLFGRTVNLNNCQF